MQYSKAVDGKPLTPEEESLLSESLQTTLRLLTKAGILWWKKATTSSLSDNLRFIRGEIDHDGVTYHPQFTCDLIIDAGVLEETGKHGIVEVGPKISMAS